MGDGVRPAGTQRAPYRDESLAEEGLQAATPFINDKNCVPHLRLRAEWCWEESYPKHTELYGFCPSSSHSQSQGRSQVATGVPKPPSR